METKRFVGSSINVILTRQTCGQRSSRAAESKHRAPGNYFSERICYKFLISKCRGDWDLGLCTTLVLAEREPLRSGDFDRLPRQKTCFDAGKIRFCHCAAVPQTQKSDFAIVQRFSKRTQPHLNTENPRSFEKYPTKVGLGISQTNADFQWNSVYLRWGWVFLERTWILSGIQFTTYFIEFSVVEAKRFVGSFVNVILTRQTCGQRSSRAAESKRRALEHYFSERICYMFLNPIYIWM